MTAYAAQICRLLLSVVLLLGAVVCGEDTPRTVEEVFARYTELPEALLPVLQSAQDQESAEKAAPALMELLPRVYDSRRELLSIPKLTPAEASLVRSKYETKMRSGWGKVFEQIYRLQRVRCYECVPFFKQFNTLCSLLEK